jgi:hypothetical protein
MGHVYEGCLRELKSTTFCIIDAGCFPLLNCLEGNKNTPMNMVFINWGALKYRFVNNL